jgi:uncharacterized protein (TIGR02271 family)
VFQKREDAERAVDELQRAGFTDQLIGIAAPDGEGREGMQTQGGTDTKGEEGGITGMLAGAFAGIFGSADTGAATGGLVSWLYGQGIPEEEARIYESEFKAGRTLVTVQAGSRYDEAAAILQRAGAAARSQTTPRATGEEQLELREERLRARKQTVESGEVAVDKEIVTEQQTMQVPVTREEVDVEYHAVEPHAASSGDVTEGDEIRVPVSEEQVRVEKESVVTGEVTIRKRQVQGTEEVTDTVRKEKPRIKSKGDVNVDAAGERTEEEPHP